MTILYADKLFTKHLTGAGHPERPERIAFALNQLRENGLFGRCAMGKLAPLDFEQIARIHQPDYVRQIKRFAAEGGGRIEADTVLSERSYEVAATAAGSTCSAVKAVLSGDFANALCLVRPPGHHALKDHAMGFCLFNNVALAADYAIHELQLDRVLIVDWDVHHGNGTQAIFYDDPQVMFFSIHRFPFYPGTGRKEETGVGKGVGFTRNEPVAFGTPTAKFRERFLRAVEESAAKLRPQLILISAGFDAHHRDPIGSLGLDEEDFEFLSDTVISVANDHCHGRIVSVLEGGYNVTALADCLEIHLEKLLEAAGGKV